MSFVPATYFPYNTLLVPQSHTGDTNRFLLHSFTLKGNFLGINDGLQITCMWTATGTNTKTWDIDFGATNIFSNAVTTSLIMIRIGYSFNQGALNSQIHSRLAGTQDYSTSTVNNLRTSAIDTSADTTISFFGTLTNTGETVGLASMTAIALKAP